VAAHGVANQDRLSPPERIQKMPEVFREVLGAVGRRIRPLALSVAALVQGDHVEAVGKGRDNSVKPVAVGRAAVEEEKAPIPMHPPLERVELEPVGEDESGTRKAAAER
jgi:hypothetical protein